MPTINLGKPKKRHMSHPRADIHKSVYNTGRWRKLRDVKLRENPLCEVCEALGRTTPAQQVHHKVKFVLNGRILKELAFFFDNLQSICSDCHSKIHG